MGTRWLRPLSRGAAGRRPRAGTTCCWSRPGAPCYEVRRRSCRPCPACCWRRRWAGRTSPRRSTRPTRSPGRSPSRWAAPDVPLRPRHARARSCTSCSCRTTRRSAGDPSCWSTARCAVMGVGAPPLTRDVAAAVRAAERRRRSARGRRRLLALLRRRRRARPFPGAERLIAMGLETLREIPTTIAVAAGAQKMPGIRRWRLARDTSTSSSPTPTRPRRCSKRPNSRSRIRLCSGLGATRSPATGGAPSSSVRGARIKVSAPRRARTPVAGR